MAILRMPSETLRISMRPHLYAVPANAPACLNCKSALFGAFCHVCGQDAKTPARSTVGIILREIPNALWDFNRALPFTILSLLRRPGHVIRDYLEGRRAKLYSPFALLFLLSGLLCLAAATLHLELVNPDMFVKHPDARSTAIGKHIVEYYAWLAMLFVPIQALGPLVVLRRRLRLGYGEQVIVTTMTAAVSSIIGLLSAPLLWATLHTSAHDTVGAVAGVAKVGFVLWAYAQLQDDGNRPGEWAVTRWLRGLGAMVAMGVALAVVLGLLNLVAIAFKLAWTKLGPFAIAHLSSFTGS